MTTVERPSAASLLLEPRTQAGQLGIATGFVVTYSTHKYLITNRHVATGRHQGTGQPLHQSGAVPDRLGIWHHTAGTLGNWERRFEQLYDSKDRPRWLIHPVLGGAVDVVALALTDTSGVDLHEHRFDDQEPVLALVASSDVFIVGFPFGVTGGGLFGVWSRGSVASEPEMDWNDLPVFLIDSRTRPGQSGSPVIQYSRGGAVALADGATAVFAGPVERLVGVYSGRINDQSDLGFVWKRTVISDILEGKRRDDV